MFIMFMMRFSYQGSETPFLILRMKYHSNASLAKCTQRPLEAQFLLRGGFCGIARKANPRLPKSARQNAFQVGISSGSPPAITLGRLWAVAVTMLSIMKPVFGTPVGTGVATGGAMAIQTPIAKMFLYFGLRWNSSTMTKPRGFTSPSSPISAGIPRNAGNIIA